MRAKIGLLVRATLPLAACLANFSAHADFSEAYALTPVSGLSYGRWSSAIGPAGGWIDPSQAPGQLTLAVPPGSLYASGLRFTTRAETNGTVHFTVLLVTRDAGGYIAWSSQRSGAIVSYQILDQGPQGVPLSFAFPVQAGDTVGFTLNCGSDAISPGTPPRISLTVSNFSAPEIPPMLVPGGPTAQTGHSFQFSFTNYPGALWRVLASTNVTLPLSNWTTLSGLVETLPGQFTFLDTQATNHPQRFYLLSRP
jgi:hypothetical protein